MKATAFQTTNAGKTTATSNITLLQAQKKSAIQRLNRTRKSYMAGIQRAYPGKDIFMEAKGSSTFVVIDGDRGDALTESDLEFALLGFGGKYHPYH